MGLGDDAADFSLLELTPPHSSFQLSLDDEKT